LYRRHQIILPHKPNFFSIRRFIFISFAFKKCFQKVKIGENICALTDL
jgi:hypothetical protein